MPRERTERRSTREVTHVVWSRVKAWFVAPFTPRVEQRVPVPIKRVPIVRQHASSTRVIQEVPASTQAREFLAWVQEDPARTGAHPPCYLIALYNYFCAQRGWQQLTWQRVGHELSLLIGEGSRIEWVDGKRQRRWHIPERVPPRVATFVSPARQRVLGPMATRVEAA